MAVMPIDSLLVKKALTDIEFESWGRVYYQNVLALVRQTCITLEPGGVTICNSIALIHPARSR